MIEFNFETALAFVKQGKAVTRTAWSRAGDVTITMHMQTPDKNSKMTKPYLYMEKTYYTGHQAHPTDRFPLDLSAESIFAEDWYEVS